MLLCSSQEKEGLYQASKWLKVQVLLDLEEMRALFTALSPFSIFPVGQPLSFSELELSHQQFLEVYSSYISLLKKGESPPPSSFRKTFASLFTTQDLSLLCAQKIGEDRYLTRQKKPAVQLLLHHFFVSEIDGKFHPMVLSKESVSWGVQFCYPQLFQDPKTSIFYKVDKSFPNTQFFITLMRWMRHHTMPTPFIYKGVRTNAPIRIGKSCFSWIQNHPDLKNRGITIYGC